MNAGRNPIHKVGLRVARVGVALLVVGCGSDAAPVAERPPPPTAEQREAVRQLDGLLRGPAIDVRIPVAECTTLPGRARSQLRESPRRIAAARIRLARLRMPKDLHRARRELDEGLRLTAEANQRLLVWAERPDDPRSGECGQSTDNLVDSAHDELQDRAKPHLHAFLAKHNPIAAQAGAATWELGAAGLIPRPR